MGRRHGKAARGDEEQEHMQVVKDPPRAALAVHPQGHAVALAVGPELRVYDARTRHHHVLVSKPQDGNPAAGQQCPEGAVVRGVSFDALGRYLAAGSEDKAEGLRIWDCATWELIQTIRVPKKVTNIAFTPDGSHVLVADKFGDVLVAPTRRPEGLPTEQQQEPEILLGHYCAILTSLSLSKGGRFLATTDRDHRVRVSVVPADPMTGAHEIQSFCQGHSAFVTCSTFIAKDGDELLVSGGGDGMLRLWEPLSGHLLHTLELPPLQPAAIYDKGSVDENQEMSNGEEAAAGDSDKLDETDRDDLAAATAAATPTAAGTEGEETAAQEAADGGSAPDDRPVPLSLAASPDGSWLVAAVDGRDDLYLLHMDWTARQLRECGWFALSGLHLPACLAFDSSGHLWAAGGPLSDESTAGFLACGAIDSTSQKRQQAGWAHLVDSPPPKWLPDDAVQKLEARAGDEESLLAKTKERQFLSSQLLRKRWYSAQQLEHRKRHRRDKSVPAAVDEHL